jgi:hypothetical protein
MAGSSCPLYEIWGGWIDGPVEEIQEDFLFDCMTLEEAREAVRGLKIKGVFFAYIRDKETGNRVN